MGNSRSSLTKAKAKEVKRRAKEIEDELKRLGKEQREIHLQMIELEKDVRAGRRHPRGSAEKIIAEAEERHLQRTTKTLKTMYKDITGREFGRRGRGSRRRRKHTKHKGRKRRRRTRRG